MAIPRRVISPAAPAVTVPAVLSIGLVNPMASALWPMPATMGAIHVPTRPGSPPIAHKFALMVYTYIYPNISKAIPLTVLQTRPLLAMKLSFNAVRAAIAAIPTDPTLAVATPPRAGSPWMHYLLSQAVVPA